MPSDTCIWCRNQIALGTTICPHCNGVILDRATVVFKMGRRFVLGEAGAGVVAIWDTASPGAPALTGGPDQLPYLTSVFEQWEASGNTAAPESMWLQRPTGSERGCIFGLSSGVVVLFILFAVAYLAIHSHRYENCIVQPGILSWPKVCF